MATESPKPRSGADVMRDDDLAPMAATHQIDDVAHALAVVGKVDVGERIVA